MSTTKPTVQRPWADTGTKTPPNDGRRNTGYVLNDIPTRAEINALINELTRAERYLMQAGISEWDAAETYVVGDLVRDPGDGLHYRLMTTAGIDNSQQPHNQDGNWARWGHALRGSPGDWDTEIVSYHDARNANRRWGIDHFGFPGGQVIQWDEEWPYSDAGTFGGDLRWGTSTFGGTVGTHNVGTTGTNSRFFRSVLVTPDNTTTTSTYAIKKFATCLSNNDLALTIQCPLAFSAVGSNSILGFFGIGNNEPVAGTNGIWVFRASGSTNWSLRASGGSGGSTVDTGVAPAANVYQRMKLIFVGANASDNGIARVSLLINGILVAHIDNPLAADAPLVPIFGANQLVTVGSPTSIAFGPIHYRQNMFPDDVF
jgi:hypothetical protein